MSYADKLNPAQKKAVKFGNGPLLIIAGAGTGKTTVITERINWLITEKKLNPEQILALTFTEKAAAEMEERVDKALPYGYVDLWISTFHSFAERILKEHGLDIGLTTDFKLLDETQSWLLARNNLDKFALDYYKPLGNPNRFIHALLKHFSRCKDELVRPQDYLNYVESYRLDNDLRKDEEAALEVRRLEEVANAYHVYQQLLLDNNYLDFGDLINYVWDLFNKRPQILKKYQNQFQYILVDEFQDTNYAQYCLVKLLAKPKNNITVVGDDDQAIYKFRGASISNILEFKKDYAKCVEVFLNTNYRSKQNILDLAYSFIQLNNPNRLEIKLKAEEKISKELKAAAKGKGMIEHLTVPTLDEEVAAVVNKIIFLKQKEADILWNNFAILVRANDQARPFIEGLEKAGIPYQFVASRGLYAKPIVLNLIAFLKLLDNYHESDAMYRFLSLPIFNLEAVEIVKLTHQAYKKSFTLFEIVKQARYLLKLKPETLTELERIVDFLEKFINHTKSERCSKIVFDFLNDSGYLKYIDSLEELEKRWQFSYLSQFYRRIKAFEEINDDKSVKNFLRQLGLELESGEQGALQPLNEDEGPEMVKIMTVHSAKGLEFKYVFMVNMVDKRFPTIERKEPIQLPDELVKEIIPEGDIYLQEERRLFYVGMTRSKDGIFFASAKNYGGVKEKKASVFLTDLGFKSAQTSKKTKKTVQEEKLENIKKLEIKENNEFKTLLPAKFSFTQLKDFEHCPRLYYYRYILKVPLKGNHYFSFGSTIHLTLQKFYEEFKRQQQSVQTDLFSQSKKSGSQKSKSSKKSIRDSVSLNQLIKFYEESWIDDWYQDKVQKNKYYEQGKEILKSFYNSPKLLESFPSYLEKSFNIKIKGYVLTGKIDRLDEVEDSFKIIDYKTGGAKEKLTGEDKEQLLLYQIAVESLFSQKVKELIYYYLEDDSQLSFLGEEKEIAKFQEKIIKTIEKIKDFDFSHFVNNHQKCDYCKNII
ncbi:ATP-dependent helicase [Patescibacteria group bacterium]|nr:ATP-dependent helicase [Patescibacteria group bacterium]